MASASKPSIWVPAFADERLAEKLRCGAKTHWDKGVPATTRKAMGGKESATTPPATSRLGFLDGEFAIPDDFDTMYAEEIRAMLEDGPLFPDEARETEQRPGAAIAHVSLGW